MGSYWNFPDELDFHFCGKCVTWPSPYSKAGWIDPLQDTWRLISCRSRLIWLSCRCLMSAGVPAHQLLHALDLPPTFCTEGHFGAMWLLACLCLVLCFLEGVSCTCPAQCTCDHHGRSDGSGSRYAPLFAAKYADCLGEKNTSKSSWFC